ncbi:hypothetical protein [Nonomuraea africana]|uniref:Uncharacterized protein n=1 Tax=Nonomuraea africana TaxID=46171 RepID=A0ABR9K701_9ACTN|nr:hypothetical protein [Nonomuraea africana]MBE1557795.1 hypothetical protein [Nonomuraea africana]
MDSALEILGFLIGTSTGLFLLISLVVLLPGAGRGRQAPSDVVWLGGPSHSEHGVSTAGLVLAGRRAHWAPTPEVDWPAEAETAEPGRNLGGASAGW